MQRSKILAMMAMGMYLCLPMESKAQKCGFEEAYRENGKTPETHYPSPNARAENEVQIDDSLGIVIPVVFHIMHNNGPENIPDAAIFSQIEVLNRTFRAAASSRNWPSVSSGDNKIQFCLATRDPNGQPSTGINRVQSAYTEMSITQEREMKRGSRWPRKRYLNIWVVRSISSPTFGGSGTIAGYAYLPGDVEEESGEEIDGITVDYRFVGEYQPTSPDLRYNRGMTVVHELGHYFNLLHPWGKDGQNQGGCDDDDGIFDTPLCSGSEAGGRVSTIPTRCDLGIIQCGSNRRMVENYMDYSHEPCVDLFTNQQRIVMRRSIARYRPELFSYPNLVNCGCAPKFFEENPTPKDTIYVSSLNMSKRVRVLPLFTKGTKIDFHFLDMSGREVHSVTVRNVMTEAFTIELQELSAGIYFVYCTDGNLTWTSKVLISN